MGDVSGEGLSSLLRRGQTPIVPQVTTQYASPSQVASMTKANPIQMQAVDAVPSPLQGIRRGASSLGLDNIEKVPVPDPTAGASQGAGMAGKALGSLGGVLQTLKGAKGMAKEGANIGNVSQSLGGMATLAGLGPIGLGLGLLGGIASLRRRK
jgi:hypothetical protein